MDNRPAAVYNAPMKKSTIHDNVPGQGKTDKSPKICSLCGESFSGFGNNPEPLKAYEERCCDVCNQTKVIPARLARMHRGQQPYDAEIKPENVESHVQSILKGQSPPIIVYPEDNA